MCISTIYAVATAAVFKFTLYLLKTLFSPFGSTILPHGYVKNVLFSLGRGEGRRQQIKEGRWGPHACPSLPPSLPCLLQANSCHDAGVCGPRYSQSGKQLLGHCE